MSEGAKNLVLSDGWKVDGGHVPQSLDGMKRGDGWFISCSTLPASHKKL